MSPSVLIKVEAIYQMRHAASFFTDAVDLQTHFNVHNWWSYPSKFYHEEWESRLL